MSMQLSTFQTLPVMNKSPLNAFYRTLFTTTIAIFPSIKENARVKFSALLFPKQVVKVVSCIDIAVSGHVMDVASAT